MGPILVALLLAPFSLLPLGAQPSSAPTSTSLAVNASTGAITAPVSGATFISANSLVTNAVLNAYFADPSTNGSFSASAWKTDLAIAPADLVSLGTGVATFLGTPSSANLAAAITDETGTGSLVFATSPTLVTPNLGTPSAATLTNATGLPISTGVSGLGTGVATFLGTPSSANLATALTDETGTGAAVFANSPTLVTPDLGTPASGTLTNTTGFPAANLAGTALPAAIVTSSLTTTGALNSGSITSGFGAIDIGTDALTAGAGSFSGTLDSSTNHRITTNNVSFQGRQAGGTYRSLVKVNASDLIEFGDVNNNNTFPVATDATSTSSAGTLFSGGIGIAKKLFVGDVITSTTTADSSGLRVVANSGTITTGGIWLTGGAANSAGSMSFGAERVTGSWTARATEASILNSAPGSGFSFRVFSDSGLTAGNTFTPTTRFTVDTSGSVNVAAATATPAGGSTSARLVFGTTSGFGIYYGSGTPTVSAAKGSLYLRSDGSSTSTRLYVNTDGSTGWTAVTTGS